MDALHTKIAELKGALEQSQTGAEARVEAILKDNPCLLEPLAHGKASDALSSTVNLRAAWTLMSRHRPDLLIEFAQTLGARAMKVITPSSLDVAQAQQALRVSCHHWQDNPDAKKSIDNKIYNIVRVQGASTGGLAGLATWLEVAETLGLRGAAQKGLGLLVKYSYQDTKASGVGRHFHPLAHIFLDFGADPNGTLEGRDNLVHSACRNNRKYGGPCPDPLVEILIEAGGEWAPSLLDNTTHAAGIRELLAHSPAVRRVRLGEAVQAQHGQGARRVRM